MQTENIQETEIVTNEGEKSLLINTDAAINDGDIEDILVRNNPQGEGTSGNHDGDIEKSFMNLILIS